MRKLVECVPNFSEGRNKEIIDTIAESIRKTEGCSLLDVDPGKSTNRTVYTFVGSPEAVVEGALAAARAGSKLIDMRHQTGEHPRIGAMDVCPFVPVANVTMDECVELANIFGSRLAEELNVPVYLYENAARSDYRKTLPQIREGEYEALPNRITQNDWKPDYGPAKFVPEWGATAVGARFFLIAYNVNILGTKEQAHRIALDLREAGRGNGHPGLLKEVKGIGWFVEEYNLAQMSFNLTNYLESAPHEVFEESKRIAQEMNLAVTGSELVGLIPLEAIMMAADYYIQKENLFILSDGQKIKLVIDRMGLNAISQFDPQKRIIEYLIEEEKSEPLADMSVRDFIASVAARTSAPGGGSVSALLAALGAGLGTMVAQLTFGVRKFEEYDGQLRRIIPPLYHAVQKLIPMIDADTNAFNDYMEAMRLPNSSNEEKQIRSNAMQEGLKKAIEVPLGTMRIGNSVWESMTGVAQIGNIASKSDVEVGARALETGIWGAYKNVMINMSGIEDEPYKKIIIDEAESMVENASSKCAEVLNILNSR